MPKHTPYVNHVQKRRSLGSEASGMDHLTVEMCIVVRQSSISGLFWKKWTLCSGPKKKRTIQTVTSKKSKSQGLSWYGVVTVPLAKVTYTSVMAPLMPKSTYRFWSNICCFQDDILSRIFHISTRQCKTTFCTHFKGMAEEEECAGAGLACLQSRHVPKRECVAHFEKRKMRQ